MHLPTIFKQSILHSLELVRRRCIRVRYITLTTVKTIIISNSLCMYFLHLNYSATIDTHYRLLILSPIGQIPCVTNRNSFPFTLLEQKHCKFCLYNELSVLHTFGFTNHIFSPTNPKYLECSKTKQTADKLFYKCPSSRPSS